jgi:hypothetical protein
MKIEDIIILLVIVVVGAAVWCFVLRQWPCPYPEPIVEDADAVEKLGLSRMPKKQEALPRPLIEYPNAAFTRSLTKSTEIEEKAKALSRPLIEYPNSAISFALEGPQTSPSTLPRPLVEYSDSALTVALEEPETSHTTLPRPLVEYSESAIVFTLEKTPGELITPTAQVKPRPLVEYADAGWIESLSPPGLLKSEE